MNVLGLPDKGMNLAGNLKDIIIETDTKTEVKLFCEGETLINESYTPDDNNNITLNVSDVIKTVLSGITPVTAFTVQNALVKSFSLEINDTMYHFSVIGAGVRYLSITPDQWLTANFLTWQPQQKNVLPYQPEYLTYYAANDCKVCAKAYFDDATHQTKTLYTLAALKACTFDVSFAAVKKHFTKQPLYWDVWVEDDLLQLSYIQRFVLAEAPTEYNYFAFHNSLGGFDVACFTGENIHKPEYNPETAKIEGVKIDYHTKKNDIYSQSTGWLSEAQAQWLHDFFVSSSRFVACDGALLPITLSEAAPEKSDKNDLCAFTFSYQLADGSQLTAINRTSSKADNITIITPAEIPFELAPRLVDFAEFKLSGIAIFPVQSPFEQKWYRASLGAIVDYLTNTVIGSGAVQSAHIHMNIPVLDSLSLSDGYLYTDVNKIKAGFADTAELADLADVATLAKHALTADDAAHADLADIATRALLADNSILWDGNAFADYLNQPVRVNDDVLHKSISAPLFVSGFSGSGWRVDEDARLTVDYLTVRKQMDVYELVINKIRASNGSIWVSDGAKLSSVENQTDNYKCLIDTDNNKNPVPFRANDIIRCQSWSGKDIKYYSALIGEVGNDYFTLVKSSFDGAGTPAAGDELVRIGNTTDTDRQGALYLTSSDNNAPYLDVIDKVTSSSLAGKTKVRLGKLNGISDADFGGALSGYGLYADNVYLKGKIHITGGNAATTADVSNAQSAAAADAATKANNAQTNAINTAATTAQSMVDTLKSTLKAMAFEDKVEIAKLGTTIIQGGYIKSELIEVGAIKISGGFATTTDVNNAKTAAAADATTKANNAQTNAVASAKTYTDTLKNSLKAMAYEDKVELAKLGTTIIQGGYIKSNLIEVNAIKVSGGFATTTDVNNAKTAAATDATTKANNAQTNAQNNAAADATTKANNAQTNAVASAKTYTDTLKNSLKAMAYEDKVELAKLGTTIIQGGYIKSELIEVGAIKISGSFATTTDVNNAKTAAAADATTKANNAQTNAQNNAAADATTKANNAQTNAVASAKTYTDTLKNSLKAMAYEDKVELAKLGTTIIQGGYIKSELIEVGAIKISGSFATTTDVNNAKTAAAADATTKANNAQTNAINTAATTAQSKVDELKNTLKSLAYLDTVELAKLGTTIIEGGFIKTSLINVDWLKANLITADYISALAVEFKQGKIGGFTISQTSLVSGVMKLHAHTGQILWDNPAEKRSILIGGIDVGGDIGNGQLGTVHHALAYFNNEKQSTMHNVGIQICVKNSLTENTAIMMQGGYISGFAVKARRIGTSQTLTIEDVYICCTNNSPITLTLPQPEVGRVIYIRSGWGIVNVAYGHRYIETTNGLLSSVQISFNYQTAMFVYDGTYWQMAKFPI